jgi:uncharacterized membrane protein YbaN (DUF454 family)
MNKRRIFGPAAEQWLKKESRTTRTEAKFYIALMITVHAVVCGLIIDAFHDHPVLPILIVGVLIYTLITSALVYHYALIAFPKEQNRG